MLLDFSLTFLVAGSRVIFSRTSVVGERIGVGFV
jgi:hypothetical protein